MEGASLNLSRLAQKAEIISREDIDSLLEKGERADTVAIGCPEEHWRAKPFSTFEHGDGRIQQPAELDFEGAKHLPAELELKTDQNVREVQEWVQEDEGVPQAK